MTYIIENATILKETELMTTSLLVKENQFAFIGNHFRKYSITKMNLESFIMTPTYCLFDSLNDFFQNSFQQKKEYFQQNFILKGSTTILTYVDVKYESELTTKLKQMKLQLINSPIDYIIGIRIPLSLLSPSFIRKCKREKITAIFIHLQENDNLNAVPWGWIREAMFPHNSPLIPYISNIEDRTSKKLLLDWKSELENQKINHFELPLKEGVPIPLNELIKLGIYPHKSNIMQGGEVSYNLYKKSREIKNIDVRSLFHYHSNRLVVTVHKGVVIRAADTVLLFRSGYGEHVTVRMPSFFSIS